MNNPNEPFHEWQTGQFLETLLYCEGNKDFMVLVEYSFEPYTQEIQIDNVLLRGVRSWSKMDGVRWCFFGELDYRQFQNRLKYEKEHAFRDLGEQVLNEVLKLKTKMMEDDFR